jgi:hypothetical protein
MRPGLAGVGGDPMPTCLGVALKKIHESGQLE